MDTLALLCNLHADGPATLQRLRRIGCESLAALRRLDPAVLAESLDWNERTAERFLREAALLRGRVEPEEGNPEGFEEPEFELESTLVEELDGELEPAEDAEDEDEDADDDGEPEAEAPTERVAEPSARVQAMLGAWRELDRVAPPAEPAEYVIPRPAPEPDVALSAAQLAGLTPGLVARLAELDVRTLRELSGARELELARALPLGFTRVKHLQFLAGQALAGLRVSAAPEPIEAFEPFTPPPSEHETAGPFA